MNFKAYYTKLSRQQKHALAVECKTSNAFLSQIAHGHRRCGESLAIQIEKTLVVWFRAKTFGQMSIGVICDQLPLTPQMMTFQKQKRRNQMFPKNNPAKTEI
jgi:hypothetical protein